MTAGIAYLTKDWAEMAQRSLATLDQELCGSWRTSLHELASKLADLQQGYGGGFAQDPLYIYIYIYIHTHIHNMCIHKYTYIYDCLSLSLSMCVYIYIYTHM